MCLRAPFDPVSNSVLVRLIVCRGADERVAVVVAAVVVVVIMEAGAEASSSKTVFGNERSSADGERK